jgi:hypothetical protein
MHHQCPLAPLTHSLGDSLEKEKGRVGDVRVLSHANLNLFMETGAPFMGTCGWALSMRDMQQDGSTGSTSTSYVDRSDRACGGNTR